MRWGVEAAWFGLALATVLVGCGPASAISERLPSTSNAPETSTLPDTPLVSALSHLETTMPAPSFETDPLKPSAMPAAKMLTICMGSEPASLHPYEDCSYAAQLVRSAIYEGPIDVVDYALTPGALERLPSLAEGDAQSDAQIETLEAREGDWVIDDAGRRVLLQPGVVVRPSGCRASGCAIVFSGGSITMDQMRVWFRLREGLRWADGAPVTADDAILGYRLARLIGDELDDGTTVSVARATARYESADTATLLWTGLPGYLPPGYAGLFWTPLPSAELEGLALEELLTAEALTRTPLGYGPYTLERWEAGRQIELRRNPYYDGDVAPTMARVIFSVVDAGDPLAALHRLAEGSCDLLAADLQLDEVVPRLLEMEDVGAARLLAKPGTTWEHVTFNVGAGVGGEARPAVFGDARTRQAVAYCLDRERITAEMTHGYGTVLHSYVPPDHPLYADDATRYDFIPDRASALLDEVGWRDEDGDEFREARGVPRIADGTPMRIRYVTTNAPERLAVAKRITAQLANCGIVVDVASYAPWELFAQNPDGPLVGGDFDLAQYASSIGIYPNCAAYTRAEIPSAEGGWVGANVGGYSDVAYDQACALASWYLPGEPGYETGHHQAQRIFADTLPVVPLYRRVSFIAATPALVGLHPDAIAVETWNIKVFDLSPTAWPAP